MRSFFITASVAAFLALAGCGAFDAVLPFSGGQLYEQGVHLDSSGYGKLEEKNVHIDDFNSGSGGEKAAFYITFVNKGSERQAFYCRPVWKSSFSKKGGAFPETWTPVEVEAGDKTKLKIMPRKRISKISILK
ncbi:hypothetical protein L21SP3_01419 [Sedimentisphaera cyanobacteriorum]|uniref:DUF1425 domain-containing protein n=1 Tax=Sedimentisphaera cyanobacteriorum TaxID=1940790 RepID=A0A1Q2HQJ0_9BACT|nr:hypothetical protein [Sedimentisphaera cyanobacteriorum]AQQ09611.1 hypothetical protein L21SP3_01419 [Sedimentisphaera cyanobacteriorum]